MRRQRVPIYQIVIYVPGETVCYIVGDSGGIHNLSFTGGRQDSNSHKWKGPIVNGCCQMWLDRKAKRSWQECLGRWHWHGWSHRVCCITGDYQVAAGATAHDDETEARTARCWSSKGLSRGSCGSLLTSRSIHNFVQWWVRRLWEGEINHLAEVCMRSMRRPIG